MSVFKKLQEVGQGKPYHGFTKLILGYHEILCLRAIKTKINKSAPEKWTILVELKNEILYLPQYFTENLTESDIKELNSTTPTDEKLFLFFGGQREQNT